MLKSRRFIFIFVYLTKKAFVLDFKEHYFFCKSIMLRLERRRLRFCIRRNWLRLGRVLQSDRRRLYDPLIRQGGRLIPFSSSPWPVEINNQQTTNYPGDDRPHQNSMVVFNRCPNSYKSQKGCDSSQYHSGSGVVLEWPGYAATFGLGF